MVISRMRGDDDSASTLQVGVDDPWAGPSRWNGSFSSFYGPTLLRADYIVNRNGSHP
jgi:hypothetical protein